MESIINISVKSPILRSPTVDEGDILIDNLDGLRGN